VGVLSLIPGNLASRIRGNAIDATRDRLGRLYREHRRGLYLLALSITRSPPDAEDAIHEAFVRLCSAILPDEANGYVFAAVRNASIDRVRRRPAVRSLSPEQFMGCATTATDDRERDLAIMTAVDGLPEDQRTVVILRVFAGLTYREIGQAEGSPIPTLAARYGAALERLRPELRKWFYECDER